MYSSSWIKVLNGSDNMRDNINPVYEALFEILAEIDFKIYLQQHFANHLVDW